MKLLDKRYKSLFFDLDNTLWDFERNAYFALRIALSAYPDNVGNVRFEQIHPVYIRHNDLLWALYRNQEISKDELIRKRFNDTFAELGISGIEVNEFNDRYLDEMAKQTHLVDGAAEVLEYLFPRYSLYIITNGFREVQNKKLKNTGLSRYFEKVFVSEDIKAPKPNLAFFEYAVKSANARKQESLVIGDDWEVDILGAANFGIDQVYLSSKNDCPEAISNSFKKCLTIKINHLSQLGLFL
jgi:putative hydrolase of the HAD superfamily